MVNIENGQDMSLRQVFGQVVRGILDDVHESLIPERPSDLLRTGIWTVVMIVLRINIEIPAGWPDRATLLIRFLLAWVLAVYGTLFLAHLVFYAARGLTALFRRAAA